MLGVDFLWIAFSIYFRYAHYEFTNYNYKDSSDFLEKISKVVVFIFYQFNMERIRNPNCVQSR